MTLRRNCISFAVVAVVIAGLAIDHLLTTTAVPKTHAASGVVAAGNSKTTCIYTGSSGWAAQLKVAEAATGITYHCIETFQEPVDTWAHWESPWLLGRSFRLVSFADTKGNQIIISTDLIPQSVENQSDPSSWEQACDAGNYNGFATTLAKNLIASNMGTAVIRLGPEDNGNWEVGYAGTTVREQQDWSKCFAQEVSAMRAVTGEHFLFDWNVVACVNDELSDLYPGDAYVNIVGVDVYESICDGHPPARGSASAFAKFAAELDGLDAVTSFARARGKPMSLPEWGTTDVSDLGVGDDGSYVRGIGHYIATHDVAFQSYFDDDVGGVLGLDSSNPKTLAAYIASFG